MRRTVVGVVAVVAATSVFTLTSLGMAEAATMIPNTQAAAGFSAFSPTAEATTLRALHDSLDTQWNAKDASAMQTTQAALTTELAKLQVPQGKAAMTPDAVTATSKAVQQNSELGAALAALQGKGMSASDLPLPGLGSLTALVQSLLATLLSIITGLLGGLPVPVPTPPLPVGVPPAVPVTAPAAG